MRGLNDFCKLYGKKKLSPRYCADGIVYLTIYGCECDIERLYSNEFSKHYKGICYGDNNEISIGIEGNEIINSLYKTVKSNKINERYIKLREDIKCIKRCDRMSTYGCKIKVDEPYFDISKLSLNIQPLFFLKGDIRIQISSIIHSVCYNGVEYKPTYVSSDNENSDFIWSFNYSLK